MASAPNVLPIFPEPDGNNSLTAIATAIRKTKFHEGLTNAELAFHIRCDPSTVENAEAERNLLKFDTVARLLRKYPQHCASIRQLWELEPVTTEPPLERIARASREIEIATAEMQRADEREETRRYEEAMAEMRAEQEA